MTEARRGHLAMLAFSALVAGSFSLGSMAAPHIAPDALNAVRFVIAAAILGLVVFATGGIDRTAFKAPWRYPFLAVFLVAYFVLMFEGLKTGAPVSMAAVFTLTPLLAAGFGWLLLKQVLTGRMAAALAIGGVGALWVIFRADFSALLDFEIGRGEVIYFFGCVAHAAYAPLVPRLNRGERPAVFTFGVLFAGAVLLLVVGYPSLITTRWAALPSIVWVTIGYTAVFASALTFFLLQYATLRLPSAKVMAYTYLTPSWVILWEMALGRPLPPGLILVGVVLTMAALGLLLKEDSQVRGRVVSKG
ncbi:DMT family transporter [Marivita sp. XM-24bin2]|uniref:DMT family transporter n=1 Tax=unclassified Marivita TaxID=2632480 RepID=UPI000D7AB0F9|nr:DMT family transporter [Marivita sp. XM-24bin2]MCR9108168.1 DMT family transporter [Paracoccaceae bacterium]PWL37081.1 MAG: EamA family transporter [Marivita sp. XM-24bin2]